MLESVIIIMIYTKAVPRKHTNQMKKLSKRKLDEFFMQLDELSVTSSPREILSVILGWMRSNREIYSHIPFSDDHLTDMLKLDADIYPVEYSPLYGAEFIHIRNCFKRYKHGYKDQNGLSRLLRYTLESLLFFEVDLSCLSCDRGGLLVLKNEQENKFFYECRQCGQLHHVDEYLNLLDKKLAGPLVPATTLDLGLQTQQFIASIYLKENIIW